MHPAPAPLKARGRSRRAALALCGWALLCCKSGEPTPLAKGDPAGEVSPALPSDPDLRVIRLENGVTFLSLAVRATQQRVVLGLLVNVGSLVEQEDERGFAHFVEHMAFNGTLHFPEGELVRFLDQTGMLLGADALAQTDARCTSYFLELPNDPATLDRAVLMLADWAHGISFEPAAVDRERSVVLAEKRLRSNLQGRLQERQNARWLRGSRHAERDPLGLESVLEAASAERLASFHRRWYQPRNFVLVANGEFDAAAMQRRIEQHFGSLASPALAESVPRFEPPLSVGDQVAVEVEPEVPTTLVEVGLKRKAIGLVSEADLRERLLDNFVYLMLQRRLRALPSVAGSSVLVADVSITWGDVGLYDALQLQANAPAQSELVMASLLGEVERVAQHGFTARELALARATLDQARAAEWKRRRGLRGRAIEVAKKFSLAQATFAWPQEREIGERLLAGITLDDVNRQGARWAQAPERQLLVVGPDAAQLPAPEALRDIAARAKQVAVAPHVDDLEIPLMATPPAAVAVASKQRIEAIDTFVWTLPNGARVLFKPMSSDKATLSFRASSPGGTFRLQGRELWAGQVAASVVSQLGLGVHDAATTQRLLGEAGVQISPWISEYEEGVGGVAYVKNMEQLFQALHLTLVAPGRDAAAFERQRRRLREMLLHRPADASKVFSDQIGLQVWGNDPHHSPVPLEALEQLELEPLRGFYLDRLGDVGDFSFVFVGDTTSAELEPLVERYLATLPGSSRADAAREPNARPRPGITRVRVERGQGDRAKVYLRFHGDEPLPANAREDLEALSAYLDIRLREVLRESLGGVYQVEVWQALNEPPRQGYELSIRFECKPEQAEALKQAVFQVISELGKSGVSPHYLEALRQQRVRTSWGALNMPVFWRDRLLEAARSGRDPSALPGQMHSTAHLASDALRDSARRYLRRDQYVDALLAPESSTKTSPH